MKSSNEKQASRRYFLNALATGAVAAGISQLPVPAKAMGRNLPATGDEIFSRLKGKYRLVLDAPKPHGIYPFAWSRVFLLSNMASGVAENDCSVMLVLRHDAICYAFEHRIWEKYGFGEAFQAEDPVSGQKATKNPFWEVPANKYQAPGIGVIDLDIRNMLQSGIVIGVCGMAIQVWTAAMAAKLNLDAETVKKDWLEALIPGIEVVPSGLWAIGRAQQHGCGYCFAG